MYNTKRITSEYLSKDILDEDFMKVFTYFRWVQLITGSCRVDARDRFVTAPSVSQKVFTLISSLSTATISIASVFVYTYKFYDYPIMFKLCMAAMTLHVTVYVSNLIHVRFINNDANVKFFIKMQETDRVMKIDNIIYLNTIFRRVNNGTVSVILILFFTLLSLAAIGGYTMILGYLGVAWNQAIFVTEICYCSNLMIYFYLRMRFVNSIIDNHLNPGKKVYKGHNILTKSFMRKLAAQSHDFTTSDTDVYLKELFACFASFQEICRFQIFSFFFNYVTFTLISFEFGIQSLMSKVAAIPEWTVMLNIIVFNTFQAIFMCFNCEGFYREITETKRLCVAVMSKYHDGPLWKKAKNMLEMIEKTPPCFSVYGMWQLNAQVMLKIFNLVTTLLVTLLQFAIL